MPTLCEICAAEYPEEFNGNRIKPLEGKSLVPLFQGETGSAERTLFWEHLGEKAALAEPWKIVQGYQSDSWELYNLSEDPVELRDLSETFPEKKRELITAYESWAERVGAPELRTVQ